MQTWYSCKVKHTRQLEDGTLKPVNDTFLIDAVSYTDAEKRIYEVIEQDVHSEFAVTNISKTNISEVINYEDVDKWYKCKVSYVTVDGDSDKELKVNTYFLVSADDIKQAYERVEDNLSSMLVPFDIPSITLTNIFDVYPYLEKEEGEEIPDNLTPVNPPASVYQADEEDEELEEDHTVEEEDEVGLPEEDEDIESKETDEEDLIDEELDED